jgi:hypothetical protein
LSFAICCGVCEATHKIDLFVTALHSDSDEHRRSKQLVPINRARHYALYDVYR